MKHEFESMINNLITNNGVKQKKSKKNEKVRDNEFIIPKYTEYNKFKVKNYQSYIFKRYM